VDGVPSLGWDDTLAFLVLPIFLVVSQFVSMELMQPKTADPAQQSSNAVLKVLPLMIGWFSLNVPSALCVYWVVNNIVTTATTLAIRNMSPPPQIVAPGAGGTASIPPPPPTIFAPPREKPSGFAASAPAVISKDGVRPITTIDAEIVEQTSSSSFAEEVAVSQSTQDSGSGKKRSGKRKKNKN
jgi:YidC/Oxa1 family membrane protein insertase